MNNNNNNKQMSFFDIEEFDYMKEWQNMPEFIQEDLTSYKKIIVHFRNEEDIKKFSELINQEITPKQKSLWFPHMPKRKYSDKLYINTKKNES